MVKKITATPNLSEADTRVLRSGKKSEANKAAAILSVLKAPDNSTDPSKEKTDKKRSSDNPNLDQGWSWDKDEEEGKTTFDADVTMDEVKINEILDDLNKPEGEEGGDTAPKKLDESENMEEDEEDMAPAGESPSNLPLKKRSKKDAIAALTTPRPKESVPAKPTDKGTDKETSTKSKAPTKRSASALKTDTPALKSALKPSSLKKSSKVTPGERLLPTLQRSTFPTISTSSRL
jgi:hypothetical protein